MNRLQLTPDVSTRVMDTGGDRPPVVLVHGLSASIEAWRGVIQPLAERFRVIAFDLPGFGQADKPDADYRALTYIVPMLQAFMDAMRLEQAHMIGSSMGASLVLRYAVRNPERVDRVVLSAPGGFGRYIHPFMRVPTAPLVGAVMSRPQRATNAYALTLTLADPSKRTRALLDEVDQLSRLPGAHRAFVRTLRGVAGLGGVRDLATFEAEARALRSPTLLIWGDKDKLFPVAQARTAQSLIPEAALTIMPGVGHFAQIDAPAAFAERCSRFLDGSE